MNKQNTIVNNSNEVSKDTVYSELYAEMRRFRDYELAVSTWYTAILIAILAALLTAKFGAVQSDFSQILGTNFLNRLLIVGFVTLIFSGGCYSVIYSHQRYNELRKYVDECLEPEWKKFKPKKRKVTPREFMLLTQALLLIAIDIIVLWP